MAHHYIAIAHSAWSRHPFAGYPALEQFIRIGSMIEESDRSDGTQSRRIEYKEDIGQDLDDNVVCEFILRYDCEEPGRRRSGKRPLHYALECAQRLDLIENDC